MLSLHFSGGLGAALRQRDAEIHAASRGILDHLGPTETTIHVSDAIDLSLCDEQGSEQECVLFCFLTGHGLVVTPWLGSGRVCKPCFAKRFLGNLYAWEHSPSIEEALQRIHHLGVEPRRFSVLPSVADLAVAALVERLCAAPDDFLWYFDLLDATLSRSLLLPVHGCECCNGRRPNAEPSRIFEVIGSQTGK